MTIKAKKALHRKISFLMLDLGGEVVSIDNNFLLQDLKRMRGKKLYILTEHTRSSFKKENKNQCLSKLPPVYYNIS